MLGSESKRNIGEARCNQGQFISYRAHWPDLILVALELLPFSTLHFAPTRENQRSPQPIAPMIVSLVAGLPVPPATGRPSSTKPIDAQNSAIPCTNSRVPSRGSTTHTLLLLRRDMSSALSSESHPSPSRNRFWRN